MMMKVMMAACLVLMFAGCANPGGQGVPSKQDLLTTASAQGKHHVTIEQYDAEERIAVVRTPGWSPETKPYQFDGTQWVPLWSPCEPPASYNQRKAE